MAAAGRQQGQGARRSAGSPPVADCGSPGCRRLYWDAAPERFRLHAVAVRLCRKAGTRLQPVAVDPDTLSSLPARCESPSVRLEWEDMKGVLDEELADQRSNIAS